MCNLMTMRKIIRCFLFIANIDKINIYKVGIEENFIYLGVYFTHLVHFYFIFYLRQRYFNIPKSVLYMKNLAISPLITLNKNVITRKKSLVFIISSIKPDQVINGTYKTRLLSMKMLTMINIYLTTLEINQSV